MSPEYAMEGLFSVKSDVFAFGILMLEIISGKKNTGFYGSEYLSLLGYVSLLFQINNLCKSAKSSDILLISDVECMDTWKSSGGG